VRVVDFTKCRIIRPWAWLIVLGLLVAAGTLDQYEVPMEIAHPECLEGRNFYNTFDDAAYQQRVSDCLVAADT